MIAITTNSSIKVKPRRLRLIRQLQEKRTQRREATPRRCVEPGTPGTGSSRGESSSSRFEAMWACSARAGESGQVEPAIVPECDGTVNNSPSFHVVFMEKRKTASGRRGDEARR